MVYSHFQDPNVNPVVLFGCDSKWVNWFVSQGYNKFIIVIFQESTMCLPIPLYHCAGMIGGSLSVVTHGSTCVLPSPSFEPSATLEAIQNER